MALCKDTNDLKELQLVPLDADSADHDGHGFSLLGPSIPFAGTSSPEAPGGGLEFCLPD